MATELVSEALQKNAQLKHFELQAVPVSAGETYVIAEFQVGFFTQAMGMINLVSARTVGDPPVQVKTTFRLNIESNGSDIILKECQHGRFWTGDNMDVQFDYVMEGTVVKVRLIANEILTLGYKFYGV